jgi:hypothetical protein
MLSRAAYIHKINKGQNVVDEGPEKMAAQFRKEAVPYFVWLTSFLTESFMEVDLGPNEGCSAKKKRKNIIFMKCNS